MSMPIHESGPSRGCMYWTFRPFAFIVTQSFGQAYAIHRSPDANALFMSVSDDQNIRTSFFFEISNFWERLSSSSVWFYDCLKPRYYPAQTSWFRSSYQAILPP